VAKYVKNPEGGVHSVADDFEAPEEWGVEGKHWFTVLEDEARKLVPWLFGDKDPAVEQARLTDERAADPEDTGIPAPAEPQPVDATAEPEAESPAEPAEAPEAPAEEAQA
jgi:hypothetical protein